MRIIIVMISFKENLIKFSFYDDFTSLFSIGTWSLQFERGSGLVTLKSLQYLGYVFYHVPGTTKYGSFYAGTGEKNFDIPFML